MDGGGQPKWRGDGGELFFTTENSRLEAVEIRTTGDRLEVELTHTKRDGTEVVVGSRWSVQRDAARRPIAILETNQPMRTPHAL